MTAKKPTKKTTSKNPSSAKKKSPAKTPTTKVAINDAASSLHTAIGDTSGGQITPPSNTGSFVKKQSFLKKLFKKLFR
jgi:hypothetical protein